MLTSIFALTLLTTPLEDFQSFSYTVSGGPELVRFADSTQAGGTLSVFLGSGWYHRFAFGFAPEWHLGATLGERGKPLLLHRYALAFQGRGGSRGLMLWRCTLGFALGNTVERPATPPGLAGAPSTSVMLGYWRNKVPGRSDVLAALKFNLDFTWLFGFPFPMAGIGLQVGLGRL